MLIDVFGEIAAKGLLRIGSIFAAVAGVTIAIPTGLAYFMDAQSLSEAIGIGILTTGAATAAGLFTGGSLAAITSSLETSITGDKSEAAGWKGAFLGAVLGFLAGGGGTGYLTYNKLIEDNTQNDVSAFIQESPNRLNVASSLKL